MPNYPLNLTAKALGLLLIPAVFLLLNSSQVQAAVGLSVGTSSLNLGQTENLFYGNIGASSHASSTFLLFQKNSANIFSIDNFGNLSTTGSITAGAFSGPITGGSISAGNVSAGTFGSNVGNGNFSFPGNVGITGALSINSSFATLNHSLYSGSAGTVQIGRNNGEYIQYMGDPTAQYLDFGAANLAKPSYLRHLVTGQPFYIQSAADLYLESTSTNNIIFKINNTERARFNSSGNLGIGTSTPASSLSLSGGNLFINDAVVTSGTPKAAITKEYLDSSLSAFGASNNLWKINGNNIFASSTLWNVGIGLSNPASKLDVAGTATAQGFTISSPSYLVSNNNLTMGAYTDNALGFRAPTKVERWDGSAWQDITGSSNWALLTDNKATQIALMPYGYDANNARLRFYFDMGGQWVVPATQFSLTVQHANSLNYIKIEQADDLAMTTNAGTLKELTTPTTCGDCQIMVPTSGSLWRRYLRVEMDLNQSIAGWEIGLKEIAYFGPSFWGGGKLLGSMIPLDWDHLKNVSILSDLTVTGGDIFGGQTGGVAGIWRFSSSYPNHGIFYSDLTADRIDFSPNGGGTSTPILSITSTNVGIGTTNPTAKLYVNGTSIFNDLATFTQPVIVGAPVNPTHAATKNYVDSQISSATSSITLWGGTTGGNIWSLNSGNVGIGKTNPGAKLDVNGTAFFTSIDRIGPVSNNIERGEWNPIWSSIAAGRALYTDEEFETSLNGVSVYNNSGGTAVQIFREDGDGSQPNKSGKWLRIVNDGGSASPGLGGFYQSITCRRNATFVQRFRAKVPVGYTVMKAENSLGTGATSYFLTPTAGTGKWEEYIRVSHCGYTGTFSNGGHVYLSGPAGAVTWYLASVNAYEIDAPTGIFSGKVGIGNATPNSSLHILNTAANAEIDIQSVIGAGNHWGLYGNIADNSLRFWGGNDYLTIKRDGKVGIGTTNPAATLEISKLSAGAVSEMLVLSNPTSTLNTGVGLYFVPNPSGIIRAAAIKSVQTPYAGNYADLRFETANGGVPAEAMRITAAGNIGIGTTDPTEKLMLGSGKLRINSSSSSWGQVQIGNPSGAETSLAFLANNGAAIDYSTPTNNNTAFIMGINPYSVGTTSWALTSKTTSVSPIILATQAGSVGIGTTTPDAKLQVNGTFHVSGALNSVVLDRLTGTGNRIVMADASGSLFATSSSAATGLPGGTSGQTLRHDGANWVANSVLYNNGTNVGIGNSSPQTRFHVVNNGSNHSSGVYTGYGDLYLRNSNITGANQGSMMVFASSYNSGSIVEERVAAIKGANDTWGNDGAGNLQFFTASQGSANQMYERMRISSAGNVGIAIINPAAKLSVAGGLTVGSTYAGSVDAGDNNILLGGNLKFGGTSTHFIQNTSASDVAFKLWNGSADIVPLTIQTSGNVGIGTTTPGTKLTVVGSGNYSIDAGNYRVGNLAAPVADQDAVTKSYMDSAIASATSSMSASNLWGGATGSNIWNLNSGNVGIGTTNPIGSLDTRGSINTSTWLGLFASNGVTPQNSSVIPTLQNSAVSVQGNGQAYFMGRDVANSIEFIMGTSNNGVTFAGSMTSHDFQLRTDNSARVTILKSSGNVGIGTTTPGTKLHIAGTSSGYSPSGLDGLFVENSGSSNSYYVLQTASVGGGRSFSVTNAGNVGVGTTTPGTRLTIAGSGNYSIDATNFRIGNVAVPVSGLDAVNKNYVDSLAINYWNLSGSNLFASSTAWNVGIGTSNPQAKLDVNGDIGFINANNKGSVFRLSPNEYYGSVDISNSLDATNNTAYINIGTFSDGFTHINVEVELVPWLLNTSNIGSYKKVYVLRMTSASPGVVSVYDARVVDDIGPTGDKYQIGTPEADSNNLLRIPIKYIGSGSGNQIKAFVRVTGYLSTNIDKVSLSAAAPSAVSAGTQEYPSLRTRLGIGTTTPVAKLEVNGTFKVAGALNSVVMERLSGTGNRIVMADASGSLFATSSSIASGVPSAAGLTGQTLRSDGTNWVANSLLYNNGTNIGIGTTSPANKLEVIGSSASSIVSFYNGSGASNSAVLTLDSNDNGQFLVKALRNGNLLGGITSSNNWFNIMAASSTPIVFNTNFNGATHSERMRITSTGNVGISTTSPASLLQVQGYTGAATDGAQNAYGKASIFANIGETALFLGSKDSAYANRGYGFVITQYGVNTNLNINEHGSSGTRLTLQSGGNIGIGTTTPGTRLTVLGSGNYSIDSTNFRIGNVATPIGNLDAANKAYVDSVAVNHWNLSGSNLFASSTSWNVGIGTTNPAARLHVAGGVVMNHTSVADTNYTALTTDYIIGFSSITTNRTVTVPDALCTPGRFFVVVDESGQASPTKAIIIDPEGTTPIIGAPTFNLTGAYNSVYIFCGNNAWYIL